MSINVVCLCGNMTRDAETRHLDGGQSVTNFSLAVNEKWKDKNSGEMKEKTAFIDCKIWGKGGEVIAQYAHKGDRLTITGRLDQETWKDKDNGSNRSKLVVNVDQFVLPPKGVGGERMPPGPPASRGATQGDEDIPF